MNNAAAIDDTAVPGPASATPPTYVIGLDAGGSKCVCYLADLTGAVVGEARGPGANLRSEGELQVEKTLHELMERAAGERLAQVAAICLGMAGVDRPADAALVHGLLRRIGARARTLAVNDALIALCAGAGSDAPGVVVVCGTGSIAWGRDRQGRAARAGGFGHLLADEGSGYWIGRRALRAVMRGFDGRGPATALTAHVLAHFGLTRPEELIYEVYERQAGPRAIASVAPAVQAAHEQGDAVADAILQDAASELCGAARAVADALALRATAFEWVLSGGVFQGLPALTHELTRRLQALAPHSRTQVLSVEPALGAVRLALDHLAGHARIPSYAPVAGG